jgi:hypothetical protein
VHSGKQLEPVLRSLRVDDLVVSTRKVDDKRRASLADACLSTGVRLLYFGLQWVETNGDGSRSGTPSDSAGDIRQTGARIGDTGVAEVPTLPRVDSTALD